MLLLKTHISSFLLLLSFAVHAQLELGFLMGAQQSKTALSFSSDNEAMILYRNGMMSPVFSVPLEYVVKPWFSIATGLSFSQEGNEIAVVKDVSPGYSFRAHRIAFLNFPLWSKFTLEMEHLQLYGMLGGMATWGLQTSTFDFETNTKTILNFENEGINRWNYGVIIGGGLERNIAEYLKLLLQINYNLGLENIYTNRLQDSTLESFSLVIGIQKELNSKE